MTIKTILHFSDVHLNTSLDAAQYGFDSSIGLYDSALQFAQRNIVTPDFVLYTGDHAVHGSHSRAELLANVERNVDMMKTYFPMANYTAIVGNSDSGTSILSWIYTYIERLIKVDNDRA